MMSSAHAAFSAMKSAHSDEISVGPEVIHDDEFRIAVPSPTDSKTIY